MSTERTRAFRRAKLNSKKKRVLHYYNCPVKDAGWIGRAAQTPKPCSCVMCGNPRKHLGEVTRQEVAIKVYDDVLAEFEIWEQVSDEDFAKLMAQVDAL